MEKKDFRDMSKGNWLGGVTNDNLNSGSLQRIADAAEEMATNYLQLQNDLDRYKRYYEEKSECISRLLKQLSAKTGHITKLKKKLAAK